MPVAGFCERKNGGNMKEVALRIIFAGIASELASQETLGTYPLTKPPSSFLRRTKAAPARPQPADRQ